MGSQSKKLQARLKRKVRIRKKILGNQERPRFSVFRSSKHIYVQIVDDINGHTLVSASTLDKELDVSDKNKTDKAVLVGKAAAKRAIEKGIKKVVFDRNGFVYHGRIKAVSDGAREAGLDF